VSDTYHTVLGAAGAEGPAAPCGAGAEAYGGAMVRRPNSGNGTCSTVYYPAWPPLSGDPGHDGAAAGRDVGTPARGPRPGGPWNGAGGRWLLWPLRVVLWTALVVIAYRGMAALVLDETAAPARGGTAVAVTPAARFPVGLAEAYAAEFGQVYLNASPQTQAQRAQDLAAFVPPRVAAADPDLGWNGTGELQLQSEQVAGIEVRDASHAVITLLATVNGRLMELGVPVVASGRGVVISGQPAWLPAPQQISPPPEAGSNDPQAKSELMNELPAFFQAYAAGDSAALSRFAAPGVSLTGLDGAVTFGSVVSLDVPVGGRARQVTATVIWESGQAEPDAAEFESTYGMSVYLQSGKWYVTEISASTEAVGAQ